MANHRQVLKKWFLISWFESDWGMPLLFTFVFEIKCSRNVNKLDFFLKCPRNVWFAVESGGEGVDFCPVSHVRCSSTHPFLALPLQDAGPQTSGSVSGTQEHLTVSELHSWLDL